MKKGGDIVGAEVEYREAIKLNPDDADAHFNLGFLLEKMKRDIIGAQAEYSEVIRIDPDHDSLAHFSLSNL